MISCRTLDVQLRLVNYLVKGLKIALRIPLVVRPLDFCRVVDQSLDHGPVSVERGEEERCVPVFVRAVDVYGAGGHPVRHHQGGGGLVRHLLRHRWVEYLPEFVLGYPALEN